MDELVIIKTKLILVVWKENVGKRNEGKRRH